MSLNHITEFWNDTRQFEIIFCRLSWWRRQQIADRRSTSLLFFFHDFAEYHVPGAYLSLRRRYNWADCNSRRTETRS